MSRPPKLRDVDPLLHILVVVMFTIIVACIIYALGQAV